MTLVAVYNSEGLVGRCDAKCYGAKTATCDCICGGRNHGAGLQRALDTTRELVDGWLNEYARQHGLEPGSYRSTISEKVRPAAAPAEQLACSKPLERQGVVMKFVLDVDLEQGVVPISKAASALAALLKRARANHQPIIVTQKGYPTGVILDIELYTFLRNIAEAAMAAAELSDDGDELEGS